MTKDGWIITIVTRVRSPRRQRNSVPSTIAAEMWQKKTNRNKRETNSQLYLAGQC